MENRGNSSKNQKADGIIIISDSDENIAVKLSNIVDKEIIDISSDDDADVPKNTIPKRWIFYVTVLSRLNFR